jgi:hypothetical protein
VSGSLPLLTWAVLFIGSRKQTLIVILFNKNKEGGAVGKLCPNHISSVNFDEIKFFEGDFFIQNGLNNR